MQNSKLVSVIIFLLFGLTVLFSFASSMFYVIESTERAVIFYKFGSTGLDKKNVITPGFGFKAPWNDLYKFDITDNLVEETISLRQSATRSGSFIKHAPNLFFCTFLLGHPKLRLISS